MSKNIKQNDWYSKLTEAEKTIWAMIYYHPTMFTNRTGVLDFMFCVIGTGLEWKDGKIQDAHQDNYLNTKQRKRSFDKDLYKKAYTNTFWKDNCFDRLHQHEVEWMRAYAYYENCLAEYVLNNIEKLVNTAVPQKSFYPVGKYSNLMLVPKNVTKDWLALAIETCDLILMTDSSFVNSNDRLQNKDNIKLVTKQKSKLIKML